MDQLHLFSTYKGLTVPSLTFDSTGTKKIACLASYVIDALENGRILVVDELDNSLHFKLVRAIIAMFNNELNTKAQLICTVHDITLLDCQKLFRKEQIWFAHKDMENAYLYSLSEFTAEKDGVRDTSDLVEKYKRGVFGALPEPDLFESLLEVQNNG
jgi:AAA15 family ATPase/GTPase